MFSRKPYESPVTCPSCGAPEVSVVCQLYTVVMVNGAVKAKQDGFRVSCQSCGTVYSAGPRGTFYAHPEALPLTIKPTALSGLLSLPSEPKPAPRYVPTRPPNASNDPLPLRFPSTR